MAWPDQRFSNHGNGTVTDNLTGLMWVTAPHSLDGNDAAMNWEPAIVFCNGLTFAGHSDWRLPNVRELQSLFDYGQSNPALPFGHPFSGVLSFTPYWSSTTNPASTTAALNVTMNNGTTMSTAKGNPMRVWPVRAGQ